MSKFLTSIWMCFLVLVSLVALRISDPKPIEQIRLISFDYYQNMLPKTISDEVVLLDIGEKSLEVGGQWPWPRSQIAQLISDLRSSNAGIIGLTVMFPEPDRFGQDTILKSWLDGNGVVLVQTPSSKGRKSGAPYVGTAVLGNGDPYKFAYGYRGIVTNISELEQSAAGVGMINAAPEVDGMVRRIPLISQINKQIYPAMPMEMIRVMSDKLSYTMKVESTGIENFRIPPYNPVITDYTGSIWIDWSKEFPRYEYGNPLPNLEGKVVLVGVTAEGIQPLVPTPMGLKTPHDIQASALQTILQGKSIARPPFADLVEISIVFVVSLLIILSVYYLPVVWSAVVFVFSLIALTYSVLSLWSSSFLLFDLTFPIISSILVFSHTSFNNFYIQFKLRQQIKKQFGTYLSPDMVAILQKDPSLLKLGGERKEMSFLFMDIVGFTPISEHYKNNDDPEGLVELVNEFLDAMTKIILKNGGTIDKYMGDCIMAFWNAPLPCKNHAEMAVKSAIEIENKTNEIKETYKSRGLPDINVGTGVNTGDCIVGNMGSESRFDYSVIGDAVNLAARLESTAARHEYVEYKTIISSFTKDQLSFKYPIKHIGDIKVKGKEELISIYSPLKDTLHK
jgi:adenylate cyclase